jgi:hypothetical protein
MMPQNDHAPPAGPPGRTEFMLARGDRLARRAQELALQLSETAARIAATEMEVALTHEHIARDGVSGIGAQAAEHARRARIFAAAERRQQERWAAWARRQDNGDPV